MNPVPRPAGVTLVGVLIVIAGILIVLGGIVAIFSSSVNFSVDLLLLVFMIVIGLIYLAVAKGIFDGSNFARILVAIISVIDIFVGAWHLFVGPRWTGLFQVVISLVILGLLFSRRATAFFLAR